MKRHKQIFVVAMVCCLVLVGCSDAPVAEGDADQDGKNGQVAKTETTGENGSAASDEDAPDGILQKASDLFDKASQSGNDGAQWIGDKFNQAVDSGSGMADDTANWITEIYESLKDQGLTKAGSAKQWLTDDIQLMGAWEYKVIELTGTAEEIETQLNDFGKLRWDCFHVEPGTGGTRYFFKKSRKSYLKNVPLRDLMKLIPLMGGGGDDQ